MNHRYLLTSLKVSLVAVLIAAIGASQAHATDDKIYPGSECVRTDGPTPTYLFSAIGNPSSIDPLFVQCPAIKDSIDYSISSGSVKVIDRNSTDDIKCFLLSVYHGEGVFHLKTSLEGLRSSSGSPSDAPPLTFGYVEANSMSHYYYQCTIPRRDPSNGGISYIVSYRVNERP